MKSTPKEWLIEEKAYDPARELYWETIFALSNGYMAARGALDEGHLCPNIRSYFGTYVAGIFDKYHAEYQAIVNVADFFNCVLYVNGEQLDPTRGHIENYLRHLDMYNGVLVRRFTWMSVQGEKTEIEITRLVSRAAPHLAVQHYRITPLNYEGEVRFASVLDGNVSNIDFHVSGYQLRDEKYHFIDKAHRAEAPFNGGCLMLKTRGTRHTICELFKYAVAQDGRRLEPKVTTHIEPLFVRSEASFPVARGKTYSFFKAIAVHTTNDRDGAHENLLHAAEATADAALKAGFDRVLEDHARTWNEQWDVADIRIEGDERDQRNVRFNIFHLIQMGNRDNPYVNIGSRGLTSEMHYGNCFWDTELFILPFFIYTEPAAARALCTYRYLTLPAARDKAKGQWLKGAMFPWMSSFPGTEQADYWEYANIAVHIVSDVAYGLMHYYHATGDEKFMLECGLEILVETARFWASRADYSEPKQAYVLTLVKGPDEYGIVNNNTYTNWNARWNLRAACEMTAWARKKHPKRWNALAKKVGFDPAETEAWRKIADNMYINYDADKDLYVEDDSFLEKKPADLKRLKPGAKITTEMGHPWDLLLRLRIVKQADVLLLMYLHRGDFTRRQLENAWSFYEPLTLHDSSLSYNTHCIVANELGLKEKADEYFQQTARLDLEDVMENVFLGIHAANAGGTWQCVVNGFGGMRRSGDRLEFNPSLPEHWTKLEFKVWFRGGLFRIEVAGGKTKITQVKGPKATFDIRGHAIVAGA
ncbi:MAG: glycoside hydrolase family 65 protein [Kiritimatiellae bacterium]|nr:glycoside hydrolase family 65 protein [Kiritimatiellia bacterium]